MVSNSRAITWSDRQRDQKLLEHPHQAQTHQSGARPQDPPSARRGYPTQHLLHPATIGHHDDRGSLKAVDRLGRGWAQQWDHRRRGWMPRPQPWSLNQPSLHFFEAIDFVGGSLDATHSSRGRNTNFSATLHKPFAYVTIWGSKAVKLVVVNQILTHIFLCSIDPWKRGNTWTSLYSNF